MATQGREQRDMSDKLTGRVKVRPLSETDLDEADRIMRTAFGTFLGARDPASFMGDADYVRTRWAAEPSSALAAELDDRLVGSNFVTRWGSVGFFGPLTVEPSLWDRGVARALLAETVRIFGEWGVSHRGLFTFGHSAKHVFLYQSYGFFPRYLTPILSRPLSGAGAVPSTYASSSDRSAVIRAAAILTDAIYPGLDVTREIEAVVLQELGDTVLVYDGADLVAFGVCHVGAGSEAGSNTCYLKFGAAQPGPDVLSHFDQLLDACENFGSSQGARTLVAGVNTSRRGAYRRLLDRGYRADMIGVTLHEPDEDGYHHPDAYVIDDWR